MAKDVKWHCWESVSIGGGCIYSFSSLRCLVFKMVLRHSTNSLYFSLTDPTTTTALIHILLTSFLNSNLVQQCRPSHICTRFYVVPYNLTDNDGESTNLPRVIYLEKLFSFTRFCLFDSYFNVWFYTFWSSPSDEFLSNFLSFPIEELWFNYIYESSMCLVEWSLLYSNDIILMYMNIYD